MDFAFKFFAEIKHFRFSLTGGHAESPYFDEGNRKNEYILFVFLDESNPLAESNPLVSKVGKARGGNAVPTKGLDRPNTSKRGCAAAAAVRD